MNVLHIAAMYSREDVVKLLLNKRGVDPFSTGGVSIFHSFFSVFGSFLNDFLSTQRSDRNEFGRFGDFARKTYFRILFRTHRCINIPTGIYGGFDGVRRRRRT